MKLLKNQSFTTIFMNICMLENTETDQLLVLDKVGSWCGLTFPGGHVEPNERFADSMIREFLEETGLTLSKPKFCGMVHWYHKNEREKYCIFLYHAHDFSGELLDSTEEGSVFWMNKEKFLALDDDLLTPNLKEYCQLFHAEGGVSGNELSYSYE